MALFQAGKAPVLVCTGGRVPWSPGARPEGEVLAARAALLGVPRRQILVTTKVANTADEARAVARHLRELLPGALHPPAPRAALFPEERNQGVEARIQRGQVSLLPVCTRWQEDRLV